MTKHRKHAGVFLAILMVGLVLGLPVLIGGFPRLGDDGATHGVWSRYFVTQWQQGEWYPRWLSGMNHGQGSAAFFYYSPVPYWATSLLSFSPVGDAYPWDAMGRSMALALILSGFTAYLWLQGVTSRKAALAGSLIYMVLPYHLAIDLYARSAIGEFWAFAWMPLILYCISGIATRARTLSVGVFVAGLAVSYALLAMTHLPTTLLMTPVAIAYTLWGIEIDKRNRLLATALIAGGLLLGVGLAMIFLMPALLMQKFAGLQGLGRQINSYLNFFLTFRNTLTPRDFLYSAALTLAACCGGFWIAQRHALPGPSRACRFWFIVAVFVSFMMVSPSRILWQNLSALQTIQFPWRFNVILTLSCTALVALAFANAKNWSLAAQRISLSLLALMVGCSMLMAANRIKQDYFEPVPSSLAAIERLEMLEIIEPFEYRTIWARHAVNRELNPQVPGPALPMGELSSGEKINIRQISSREILFEVSATRAVQLTIRQFYFPGWHAEISSPSGNGVPKFPGELLAITPTQPEGLMAVSIPAGKHWVRLQLRATAPERRGGQISLVALVLILGIGSAGLVSMFRKHPTY